MTRTALHVLPHRGGGAETYLDAVERALGEEWRHQRFALSGGRSPLAALRSLPARWPALVRAARRADVVHVHGDVAAVLAAPLPRRGRSLMTTHGLHFLRRSHGPRRALFGRALRAALARCELVLCTSAAERDELAAMVDPGCLAIVHNAPPPLGPLPDRAEARRELGLDDGDVATLFVGRLEQRKRPLLAASAALAAGPPVVLLAAGDGPQAPELRARAGERVRALGHVADVRRLLAAADVFVAPADREGLSYALLEAMDAGLAIVASDAPGNAEAVGDAARLFPAGDEHALAEALRALAADPDERARLGAAARERARGELGEERFAAAIRRAYDG